MLPQLSRAAIPAVILALLFVFFDPISALGINCRGSLICAGQDTANLLSSILTTSKNINVSYIFANVEQETEPLHQG